MTHPEPPAEPLDEAPQSVIAPGAAPDAPEPRIRLRRVDVVVLLAILALGSGVRFARLDEPGAVLREAGASPAEVPDDCRTVPDDATCYELIPLDEKHYVPDARDVLAYGTESDRRVSEASGAFVVHPPVGKWMIAIGIEWFGDRPFGWRFGGALLGSLSILVMYLLALRLFGSAWWAAAAALLLAVEGLWFVQSRVAMLDIFLGVFVLLGVWLLVEDRARVEPDRPGPRPLRIASGVAFGLAMATKWSAAPFLLAALIVALAWEKGKTSGALPAGRVVGRFAAAAATFTLVPALVYVFTFVPWLGDEQRYVPPACPEGASLIGDFRCYHGEMLDFHRNLEKFEEVADEDDDQESASRAEASPTESPPAGAEPVARSTPGHPYFAEAWTWPWAGRPVVHHFATDGEGDAERRTEVIGIPNVAIWWPAFFVGIPALIVMALRRDRTAALLLLFVAAGYGPYLLADVVSRPVFMFYATPLVPFLVLGVVYLLARLVARRPAAAGFAAGYVLLAAGVFVFFYPVLAAAELPGSDALGWSLRMWLQYDCVPDDMIRRFCWI